VVRIWSQTTSEKFFGRPCERRGGVSEGEAPRGRERSQGDNAAWRIKSSDRSFRDHGSFCGWWKHSCFEVGVSCPCFVSLSCPVLVLFLSEEGGRTESFFFPLSTNVGVMSMPIQDEYPYDPCKRRGVTTRVGSGSVVRGALRDAPPSGRTEKLSLREERARVSSGGTGTRLFGRNGHASLREERARVSSGGTGTRLFGGNGHASLRGERAGGSSGGLRKRPFRGSCASAGGGHRDEPRAVQVGARNRGVSD
jgi:hypothetical protein